MPDPAADSRGTMLAGIRVLDMATLAAGPLAATYLGEFGADVIKIEQPQGGDPIRGWGVQDGGNRADVEKPRPQQEVRDHRPPDRYDSAPWSGGLRIGSAVHVAINESR